MDNLRSVIKILFRYVSPTEVLSGSMNYGEVCKDSFIGLANSYMRQYSNNEIENMLYFLSTEFEWHNNKMRGRATSSETRGVNVFDAILMFSDSVLVEENGMPLCCYEHLLRWREMIVELDEDLFITAFLAQKDLLSSWKRQDFFWAPVIGHNNKALNRLMAQGVAENHFHLKGSSPLFHLSWISMMNDVLNPDFRKTFNKYEERRLNRKVTYQTKYTESPLYISYIQAALLRLYLFSCLQGDVFTLRNSYIELEKVEAYINWSAMEADRRDRIRGSRMVNLDELRWDLGEERYLYLKKYLLRRDVEYLLHDIQEMFYYLPEIQENIVRMREKYAEGQMDYTICKKFLADNPKLHLNEVISGERWFLYEAFRRIYSEDQEFLCNLNWLYAYILIKENIRAELIQVNNNVGFHNFLLYQNRKEAFIDDTPFEKVYLQMAVRDTILNQHIHKLEARITPKKSWEEIKESVEKYDRWITEKEEPDSDIKSHFFYVCHFIKERDDGLENLNAQENVCRHFRKRLEVERQANAIWNFRKNAGDTAFRIRGIDAASEEIGCRPEVFAQAFRFLRNQSVSQQDYMKLETRMLPDLCVTYHVGEDFLDLIDGLRAIDEAVYFLNMRCGDRLGHALALGVDVEEWYRSKSGYVLISQMDYLDNLVWLYSKIRKYRLEGCEDTIRYIEKRYDEYFRIVYLNNMRSAHLEAVMDAAIEYYEKEQIQNNYWNRQCYFSINTYYDSWKLRGDNPEFFRRGYFQLDNCAGTKWDDYGINKIFPENYRIRYNPEAAYLYHTYHYNMKVKMEGNKRKEIKLNPCIIKAVKKVQKRMQWLIGQKGIGIETNPSSNILIGTFKRYDKHPILNWYNNGLATDNDEIQSVPQLQVSINTDDQGVFATYIENEYAYLALALEKMKDEDGNPRYSRTLIYQWLDNIRKMGLAQSFDNNQ